MSSLFGKRRRIEKGGDGGTTKTQTHPAAVAVPSTANATDRRPPPGGASSPSPSPATPPASAAAAVYTFADLNLCPPLLRTCAALGYKRPTPVQRTVIPAILSSSPSSSPSRDRESSHILALSATGSGKTAAFALPMLHTLSADPYGIYGIVLTPTRELAKQINEQILALGSSLRVKTALVVGGMDMVRQSCDLARKPHFVVATPGRLAALLRGSAPPSLRNVRYVVLDEADRLLAGRSGFERDVAEVLLHSTTVPDHSDNSIDGDGAERRVRRVRCQTLLFSATLTRSLASLEEMAGAGLGRLPLRKFVIRDDDDDDGGGKRAAGRKRRAEENGSDLEKSDDDDDDDDSSDGDDEKDEKQDEEEDSNGDDDAPPSAPRLPAGLKQEYVFMPSHVRDAYLLTAVRTLMANGGRHGRGRGADDGDDYRPDASGWNDVRRNDDGDDDDEENGGHSKKARSAIIFVSTCERAALVSGILTELGISNVALHSLLTQNRRLASLGKFKSQHVRVLVATDVASRGLDVPSVDLVLNAELPRRAVDYVHRVGRTARAGRRGRAVSFVGERDVSLIHAAERAAGCEDRPMTKCPEVTDEAAVRLLGPVSKAARLAKMKLADVGFDDLVKRHRERKARDRRERHGAERAARKAAKRAQRARGGGGG